MTKVGDEEVRNESPNNGVFEVFSVGVSELIGRNVFSMSKIGSPCRLVFDLRKDTDGFDARGCTGEF